MEAIIDAITTLFLCLILTGGFFVFSGVVCLILTPPINLEFPDVVDEDDEPVETNVVQLNKRVWGIHKTYRDGRIVEDFFEAETEMTMDEVALLVSSR